MFAPAVVESFSTARKIVCGQNCTFVIQADGSVLACGEGSYGRLGQGNSDDLHVLTVISCLQGFVITDLASSVGSDGHSLALAESGEVFSWGDGDYGMYLLFCIKKHFFDTLLKRRLSSLYLIHNTKKIISLKRNHNSVSAFSG